ncbi:MAG: UDP-glucose 4-epimerase GalE [Candidatus Aminicenantes bacterium]|nr:UDP-glucose 4-epimerase GalE [Candidatus Aminicenantes bacterium]
MNENKAPAAGEPILVTGGAGYIGSHVVRDLGEQGYRPVIFDNLSSGRAEAVLYGELIRGDIADRERLGKIMRQYSIRSVMHFAAFIQVGESVLQPMKYYENNAFNCLALIKTCLENGVENFIFSSTAAVYGMPEKVPVDEKAALQPINPYGNAKLVSEMMLHDVAVANPDFRYVALRYFNAAGADRQARIGQDYRQPTHLLTRALKTALGQYPELEVFGTDYPTPDGTAIRDYIHIDDLAVAHLLALEFLKTIKQSRVFNCGYGIGHSVFDVIAAAKRVSGIDFPVVQCARRPGDPAALIADAGLIHRELGWKPDVPHLDDIVASAWNWEKKLAASRKH